MKLLHTSTMGTLDPIRKKFVDPDTPEIDKHMRKIEQSYKETPSIANNIKGIARNVLGLIGNTVKLPLTIGRAALLIPLTTTSFVLSGVRTGTDYLRMWVNTGSKKIDDIGLSTRERIMGTLEHTPKKKV